MKTKTTTMPTTSTRTFSPPRKLRKISTQMSSMMTTTTIKEGTRRTVARGARIKTTRTYSRSSPTVSPNLEWARSYIRVEKSVLVEVTTKLIENFTNKVFKDV